MGADNQRAPRLRHPPRLLRLVRALHRHPRRALRRRVPVLARARAGAADPGRRGPPRGRRASCASGSRRRASGSTSTSATRRSASGSATPSSRRSPTRRLRRPRVGRLARRARAGRRAVDAEPGGAARRFRRSLLLSAPESRSGPLPLTFLGHELIEGSTESVGRGNRGRCLQRFLSSMRKDSTSLVKSL